MVKTGKRGPHKKPDKDEIRQMQEKYQERIRNETEKSSRLESELTKVSALLDNYLQKSQEIQRDIAQLHHEQEAMNASMQKQFREVIAQLQQ